MAPAADPRPPAGAHHLRERRQQRRITPPPDKARTDHDRVESVAIRFKHELLGLRLG